MSERNFDVEGKPSDDTLNFRLDLGNDVEIIDPAAISGSDGGGIGSASGSSDRTGKRRGRKPGSRNSPKAASDFSLSEPIHFTLVALHTTLHALTQIPELAIDDAEAKNIGEACDRVAQFYPSVREKSAKGVAWAALATILASTYGLRMTAYRMRKANEAAERKKTAQGPVVHAGAFRGNG
jgi:hypothetical protein